MKHLPIFDTPHDKPSKKKIPSNDVLSFDMGYRTPLKPSQPLPQKTQKPLIFYQTFYKDSMRSSNPPAFHSGDTDVISPFTRQPSPFEPSSEKNSVRKMSTNDNQFKLKCPQCASVIHLLDGKSSKNPSLEKTLKDLLNQKKASLGESIAGMEFERGECKIENKYGKYVKKYTNPHESLSLDSPLASRNIMSSGKKEKTINITFNSSRKNDPEIDDTLQRVHLLEENLLEKEQEIFRLTEINKKMMQEINDLMRVKLI